VSRRTGSNGTVTLRGRGAGLNSLPNGGIGAGGFRLAQVHAGGILLKAVTATTPDQNGAASVGAAINGIDATDGVFLLHDFFNHASSAGRSDLDCSGQVSTVDLSAYLQYRFNDSISAAPQSTTYCP
jgi:hypothetical protein